MNRLSLLSLGADGLLHAWDGLTVKPPPPPPPPPYITGTPVARIRVALLNALAVTLSGANSTEGTSGAHLTDYVWDMGDGVQVRGSVATHVYDVPGTYLVTLTVTDSLGATNTSTHSVVATPPVTVPPTPIFTVTVNSAASTVSVDASGTIGTIRNYQWQFGDGGADTGVTSSHTYADYGTYLITLTVTDTEGVSSKLTHPATIVLGNLPPDAELVITDEGMSTSYDASTSSDPNGDKLSYVVDWGDGSPVSSGVKNSHTYSAIGPWLITLTVTDSHGLTDTATGYSFPVAPIVPGPPVPGPPPPPVSSSPSPPTSGPGDHGVNQTGTSGKQQIGSGIILFQSLTSGSDLTATIKANGTKPVSFAAGTFEWRDFLHGIVGGSSPSGNNASGLQLPSGIKQVLGAGSASTRLQMTAHTSSKGGTVPSTGTNQLHYIDTYQVADGFVWDGINMVGTDQGHLYNGLALNYPGNGRVSNSTFSGVPGQGGSPPGETSMVSLYQQAAGKTFDFINCTFDGRLNGTPVTSAMLATNTTRGVINIKDCLFQHNLGSAGPTIWELASGATINLIRPVTKNLHRNVGNEAQGGTINIYDPLFGDPSSGEDDIRITWTSNYNSGTINVYFSTQANWDSFVAGRKNKKLITICTVKQAYGGSAGGAYTGKNDIRNFCHVYIGGVQKNLTDYWTFTGNPVN